MRKLAMPMLFITGCAAAPTSEQVDAPPIMPAMESVTGEVVLGPDDVGGGGPSGGVTPVAEGESGGSGGDVVSEYAGDAGGTCEEGGDETCEAAFGFGWWLCTSLCSSVFFNACPDVAAACSVGEAVTVGGSTIPCAIAIAAACVGSLGCVAACQGVQ